jgi:tRNA(Ile)-lysidine synthase
MRRSIDDLFHRPLLDVTRAQTEAACMAEGIAFWTDPHNSDPQFTRARVRQDVLPLLERELGPGVAAALARTADQLRADADHLDDLAESALSAVRSEDGLSVDGLTGLSPAIRTRVLRLAALEAGALSAELFHAHVLEMDRLVTDWHGQRWVDLPGHLRAVRRGDALAFDYP